MKTDTNCIFCKIVIGQLPMGTRGTAASSEAAGVVLLVDRLDRLAEALRISHRARAIAVESVVAGMGLSFAAMAAAALGYLPPLAGAVLQEAIDVAVILNALRALRVQGPREGREALAGRAKRRPRRFCTRHALVHGAEMAESRGRTSGCVARRGPRLPRRSCATTL